MASRRLYWLITTMIVVAGMLALFAAGWATRQARASADAAAQAAARAHVGLLSSELQKFRLLPLVLADYPDVARALSSDGGSIARLDRTLELFAARTDAAAIYVIDRNGRAVAASNWRRPTSFVGEDYGFRPYFTEAMRRGSSEHFALGTVSGRPGLYLARRVDGGGRAVGVVVVKVEFDRVEASWARTSGRSIVTDANGVVLVTSVPGWRFRTTRPLDSATLADARRTLQFGATPPTAAPLTVIGAAATVREEGRTVRYRVASLPVPVAGGRLLHLAPLEPALAAARSRALLWALSALLAIGVAGVFASRSTDKRRLQRAAQDALEHEVARRTAELSAANAQLTIESAERLAADLRYRDAREELAQANRLGSIGQITAGVAHEINQPVAAIRTFAENGSLLLERGRIDTARENLAHIVGLTERIGAITAELRAFARRKTPATGETEIGAVLDGLLLLIGERGRRALDVRVPPACRAMRIVGDRIRIEQVLVNLVTNALDAVKGQGNGQVVLTAAAGDGVVILCVSDNGPGIDPALVDSLFSPFVSSKPEGLGLGLAIAQNIAREFGGDLVCTPYAAGAEFVVRLRIA
jgi:two-component system C4-dicarboxylate transport sensor histidine kinase DctB